MSKRINIVLSEATLRVIDRLAKPRQRSRFISEAVHHYVTTTGRSNLREQLKKGAIARAERDLDLAEEYFVLEQETWPDDKAKSRRK